MKRHRVALVINDLIVGGAQKLLLDLIPRLTEKGFIITVFVLYKHRQDEVTFIRSFQEKGIQCIFLDSERKSFVESVIKLYKALNHFNPDILHSHLPNAVIVTGIVRLFLRKVHIIHEHQDHVMHSWKIRLAIRIIRLGSVLTICYTDLLEKSLFGKVTLLNDQALPNLLPASVTILNGVDIESIERVKLKTNVLEKRLELGIHRDRITITSVSRMIPWKGQEHLVYAFTEAIKINPQLQLCLVGEGEQLLYLKELVNNLHLQNDVFFLGSRNDVYSILAASDIFSSVFQFVKTDNTVAMSINGLEAMACHLPVIIGNQGNAAKYVMDKKNGFIVDARSVSELCNTLLILASNTALRHEIGERAKQDVTERFSVHTIARIYEQVYYKVIS